MSIYTRLHMYRTARRGQMLVAILVITSVAVLIVSSIASWAGLNARAIRTAASRELAFHVAEAGIDYYRWHLAHAQTDYKDGTGAPGPYVHEFRDADGTLVGHFSLTITAPPIGSTIVRVRSTGTTIAEPGISRTIEALLAIPSFAKYAWVLNSFVSFGSAAEVTGPVHSNYGIHFDGFAHNLVTSATSSFDDPDDAPHTFQYGVYTTKAPADPTPPTAVPNRPDVFAAGRQFPVPAVDFAGIISDLSDIKDDAVTGGKYFGPSGFLGYHIVLNKTNDTYDVYAVKKYYTDSSCSCSGTGCGTWSIKSGATGQTLLGNYPLPANGLIFFEDNVWVDGAIDGARLTIASARFPDEASTTRTNIILNGDLLYTKYDGTDSIGLISQGNVLIGLVSNDTLRVDAAVIAQNGFIGRYSYTSDCSPYYIRTLFTAYGMLASNQRSGFWYGDNGYQTRKYIYDANLLYAPPPSFPLTSDQYTTLSWQEIK